MVRSSISLTLVAVDEFGAVLSVVVEVDVVDKLRKVEEQMLEVDRECVVVVVVVVLVVLEKAEWLKIVFLDE